MYIKIPFVVVATTLFLLLSLYKVYICKKQRTEKISVLVSVMGGLFVLYVLGAFILAIFIPGILNKLAMIFFGISPFIIGKLATYEKENFFSLIQIIFVVVSIVYVTVS